jgi:hypothetical protein
MAFDLSTNVWQARLEAALSRPSEYDGSIAGTFSLLAKT